MKQTYGRVLPWLLPLMVVALLASSCSTTRGGAYSSSVDREAAAAAASKKRAQDEKKSPPAPRPAPSGQPSYYDNHYNDDHETAEAVMGLIVDMARIATSGYIVVDGLPAGAYLYIDGNPVGDPQASTMASPGRHYVRAEAFGYMPWAVTVDVSMRQTSKLEAFMDEAPFTLGAVLADPSIFDPLVPGSLGRVSLVFKSSGPGEAQVEILEPSGRLVYSKAEVAIKSSRTTMTWDGKDNRGRDLPAGDYRIRVRAMSSRGSSGEAWGDLKIVSEHAVATYSSLAGGFSGALYAPDARILPGGHLEMSSGATAVFDPSGADMARIPAFAGIRMGLGGMAEMTVSAMGTSYPGYDSAMDWGSVAASAKFLLAQDETFAASLLVGGAYGQYFEGTEGVAPSWDGPSRFPGGNIGIALESDSDIARAFVSVQAQASNFYPGWTDISTEGFYSWAYLRGGLEFIVPDLIGGEGTFAFSAAGRTSPFNSGLSFTLPLSIGTELHWYVPNSNAVISVYGTGEWESKTSWYLGAGFGLGFML